MSIIKLTFNPVVRKSVIIGLVISGAITLSIIGIVGSIYSSEAIQLLSALQRSTLYYGTAVTTASATILALVLTMLSLAGGSQQNAKKETYIRFRAIAMFCVYGFVGGIVLLLGVSFPVEDFENIPSEMYNYLFYILCIWNGMLCAYLIAIILILRDAINDLIAVLSPDFDEDD